MAGRAFLGIPREKIPWQPQIDADKCVGCGDCLEICANGVFVLNEDIGKVEVAEPTNCVVLCDKCAAFCATEAISFPEKATMKRLIGNLLQRGKVTQTSVNP